MHGVVAITLNVVIVAKFPVFDLDQPLISKLNSPSWSTVMKPAPSYCAKMVLGLRIAPPTPLVPVASTS